MFIFTTFLCIFYLHFSLYCKILQDKKWVLYLLFFSILFSRPNRHSVNVVNCKQEEKRLKNLSFKTPALSHESQWSNLLVFA